MTSTTPLPVTISVEGEQEVSALLQVPDDARAGYVFAHGAGAGMTHPFMASMANELASRGVATLRYQFPYMEKRSKRPDSPKVAQATVRAAVAETARRLPGLVLVAGGKSFGGRMTSQAQAASPLPDVRGLAFVGFPLHPAGVPSSDRAQHLFDVQIPMLFLQGTRDELAHLALIEALASQLGPRASLELFAEADHSFHVPKRSGRTDAQVIAGLAESLANWIATAVVHRKESG